MTRLNLLLLGALIASALVLVKSAYDVRRLTNELHRSDVDARRLAGEHTRLEAERQLQATNLRVERTARERLQMRTATPAVTMYEGRSGVLQLAASAPATQPAAAGASR
jgi:cell division protein FtsL